MPAVPGILKERPRVNAQPAPDSKNMNSERWLSGRKRSPAKGVRVKSPSRVRIPLSPPEINKAPLWGFIDFLLEGGLDAEPCSTSRRSRFGRRRRPAGATSAARSQSLSLRQKSIKPPCGAFLMACWRKGWMQNPDRLTSQRCIESRCSSHGSTRRPGPVATRFRRQMRQGARIVCERSTRYRCAS